jgi:hypothetical protein
MSPAVQCREQNRVQVCSRQGQNQTGCRFAVARAIRGGQGRNATCTACDAKSTRAWCSNFKERLKQ